MEQPIHVNTNSHNYLTDSLKTIIDSLKAIFTSSLKGPPSIGVNVSAADPLIFHPSTINNLGNFALYSHQRALIEEMRRKESAFRTGATIGPLKTQLFSKFAILGDPIGTGKTITSLAYIATCKRVPLPPISPQLHPQSNTNFFSTSTTTTTTKTNIYIVPNMDIPIIKDALENQNQLRFRIIKKANNINQNLIDELNTIDVIVIPVTQYSTFSQFMIDHGIIFERCFFENIDNIYLSNNTSHLIANFTWLITNNWFNLLFPETCLFDYGITLDNFINTHYPNLPNDMTNYLTVQRMITQHTTPNSRSIFNNFIVQHPLRHHLLVATDGNYLAKSLNPGPLQHTVLHYNNDERFQVIYQMYSSIIKTLIDNNDIYGALEAVGAQMTASNEVIQMCRDQHDLECPICFTEYNIPTLTPCCKNIMCAECILKSCSMNNTNKCPFCRQEINGMKLISSEQSTPTTQINTSKTNVLVEYLKSHTHEKILLYFPNEARFGKLKKALKMNNIHYELLNGPRTSNRAKIEKFNSGRTNILIVHDYQHLMGYYLSKVSHLIIYPDYTNANIRQYLMGRIQSFVRVAPLTVVDFVFDTAGGTDGVDSVAGTALAASGV